MAHDQSDAQSAAVILYISCVALSWFWAATYLAQWYAFALMLALSVGVPLFGARLMLAAQDGEFWHVWSETHGRYMTAEELQTRNRRVLLGLDKVLAALAGAIVASVTAAGLTPAGFRMGSNSPAPPSDDNLFTAIVRFFLPLSLGAIVIWQAHTWLPLIRFPMTPPRGDGERAGPASTRSAMWALAARRKRSR